MLPYVVPVINFFRAAIPAVCLFGSTPILFLLWVLIRLVTSISSSPHIYRRYDDYFYSMYQQLIIFFFEKWVNVKVCFVFYLHFFSDCVGYLDLFSWRLSTNYQAKRKCFVSLQSSKFW
jgi:hypothetical protein